MKNGNIFALFEQLAAEASDDLFMETEHGATYRYADLLETSARYANALISLGVTTGDRVAVQVEKSADNFFLYLAALRMGAIYLPLNTAYTDTELSYFLANAQPRVYVCDPKEHAGKSQLAATHGISHTLTMGEDGSGTLMKLARKQGKTFASAKLHKDDVAAILYTSGTTGRPKGAMLTHANLASNGQTLTRHWHFTRQDVLLHALPLFHGHGLFISCHCALFSQSRLLLMDKFDTQKVAELIPRATVMMGVPTYYTRMLQRGIANRELCANIRLFISGSAPLLPETARLFQSRTDHVILERYGMTETAIITSNPYIGPRRIGSVGKAIEGVEIRIVDDDDEPQKTGHLGEIQVRGPSIMKGYWNMPEKTTEAFTADGWFRTGDRGTLADSGYLDITGRTKDMIISGGYNVYPKEIETLIDAMPGVVESAVIGVPDDDFGETVAAIVIMESKEHQEEDIITPLKKSLANYKVPKRVFFVEQLPRNTMGKVLKNELRDQYKYIIRPSTWE